MQLPSESIKIIPAQLEYNIKQKVRSSNWKNKKEKKKNSRIGEVNQK